MPKKTLYPRLRTKVYRGKGGQAYVYYVYDMRPDGEADIRLGTDYAVAIAKWDELHNHRPRTIGTLQEAFDRWRKDELPKYDNPETRRGYSKNLAQLEPVFGTMGWHDMTLPMMRTYLDRRTAKTQGNREMSLLSIVWGKARLWGMTQLPWPAAGVKNWKNQESAREFEVSDEIFATIYGEADQVLRDCMDVASATAMRLTDVRGALMPVDGVLRFRANKTRKAAEFQVAQSPVLTALVARRQAMKAHSVMLLTTETGRTVTQRMLRTRWDDTRAAAALKARDAGKADLADQIEAMYLRDNRKRAADLSDSPEDASKLLQHSDQRVTEKHYRTKATKLRAVR